MNILNINFTSFFLDLTYFSSQFSNDMDIYLIMIIALAILAIGDLVVGVSNDAVNFLNSALGSKAISVRNIMILASLGVAVGAVFSSGMMEVARKGIFNPNMFFFSEIMIIFMAVMITDILLLDFFNTLGGQDPAPRRRVAPPGEKPRAAGRLRSPQDDGRVVGG